MKGGVIISRATEGESLLLMGKYVMHVHWLATRVAEIDVIPRLPATPTLCSSPPGICNSV